MPGSTSAQPSLVTMQGAWRDCDDEDLPSRPKQFKPKSLVKALGGKRKGSGRKRKGSGKASGKRRKSGLARCVWACCSCLLLLAAGSVRCHQPSDVLDNKIMSVSARRHGLALCSMAECVCAVAADPLNIAQLQGSSLRCRLCLQDQAQHTQGLCRHLRWAAGETAGQGLDLLSMRSKGCTSGTGSHTKQYVVVWACTLSWHRYGMLQCPACTRCVKGCR